MSRYIINVNNTQHVVDVEKTGTDEYSVQIGAQGAAPAAVAAAPAHVAPAHVAAAPAPVAAAPAPVAAAPAAVAAAPAPAVVAGKGAKVKAPMPGVIDSITVKVGDSVVKGDTVMVLEAMKMKNDLKADVAGTVAAILVSPGQQVKFGEPLLSFE